MYLTNLLFWLNKHKNNQSFIGSTKRQIINIIMSSTTKFLFYKPKFMRMKQLKKKKYISNDFLFINNFDFTN